jgi:hypothetical protein
VRDPAQYEKLRILLRSFTDEPLILDDFEMAARFSNTCRATGIAGSPVDLLICSVAFRERWPIFTRDLGFRGYARVLKIELYNVRLKPTNR